MNNTWTTRIAFQEIKRKFFAHQATEADLDAAADAHIEALKAYRRTHKGVRFPIPTRASLRRSNQF